MSTNTFKDDLFKLHVEAKDNCRFLSTLERHFKVRWFVVLTDLSEKQLLLPFRSEKSYEQIFKHTIYIYLCKQPVLPVEDEKEDRGHEQPWQLSLQTAP